MFETTLSVTACRECFDVAVNGPGGGKIEKVPDFELRVALTPVDGRQQFTLTLPANVPATRALLTRLARLADQSFADTDSIEIEFAAIKSRTAASA